MRTYKLTIAYDGTRYQGWQRQSNTENTIQGILEDAVMKETGPRTEAVSYTHLGNFCLLSYCHAYNCVSGDNYIFRIPLCIRTAGRESCHTGSVKFRRGSSGY